MGYTIRSSEKTSSSASEMETKALLHLLCEDRANGNIIGFAIDFFNDVTGMDRNALRLYDIQSKGTDSGPYIRITSANLRGSLLLKFFLCEA